MFRKTKWTLAAFLNRNWKFLMQTGATILDILHKQVRRPPAALKIFACVRHSAANA